MSTKKARRRLRDTYHVELGHTGESKTFAMTIHGRTATGANIQVTCEMNWSHVPYWMPDLRKLWSERLAEEQRHLKFIDDSVNPKP